SPSRYKMKKKKTSKPRIDTRQPRKLNALVNRKLLTAVIATLAIAGSLYAITKSRTQPATATETVEASDHCDSGISKARVAHPALPNQPVNVETADASASAPPFINSSSA